MAASKLESKPDITIAHVPGGGLQPQAVMDSSGTLHLLYYTGDPGHGDLNYVRSSDGGATWSNPIRVNSVPGSAVAMGTIRGGQIALGRNGRVHVAWNGSSAAETRGPVNPESGQAGAPMLYSRMNDARTGFEPQRNLMTKTFGLDGGGTVAADARGNVYVAWHGKDPGAPAGEAGRQVWIAQSTDDGKTFAPEHPAWNTATGACGCCGMAMFADSKANVYALYRSATENVHRDMWLLASANQGRVFEGRKIHTWNINACPMSSMSFAESRGRVEGAWETGGEVYFETLSDPSATPVSAPGQDKGRKHPRIAALPNGDTLLVWTEGTGWKKGGSLAWQLYDGKGEPIGEKHVTPGVPAWSFGAVAAKPGGFVILY